MITATLALCVRILSNPVGNVFQKRLTEQGSNPLVVNFLTFLILSAVCAVPAMSVDWAEVPFEAWEWGAIAGVFGATGNAFLVKALQGGDLSILAPINSYKSVVGILVGILFLHEMPNLWGVAGVALIICGSYFVLDTMKERFSWALLANKDIQCRVLAMVLCAIEAIFIKKVILYSNTSVSFLFWCWFGAVFSFALLFAFHLDLRKEFRRIERSQVPSYAALVLCIGLMQYTTNYVFARINVGYALALFQLSTVVSIFLGWHIFKETDIRKKLLGAAIMIAGSVMIILLN